MAWQRVKIELPEGLGPSERESIGLDIISFIQERSIQGIGFNPETGRNKRFPNYTKEYARFKGADISDVDLILSGDMFNAMQVLSNRPRQIVIGFENGTKENDKAEGNQLGSYGKEPDPKKARPFLGLTKKDLEAILENYGD